MTVKVSKECWTRWKAVIRHLAAVYGFPATSLDELNIFLRMYSGGGSTYRAERERWKFVIDVTRRGAVIADIVAITLTAKTVEDERHNGAVITRACAVHPATDDEDYVGSPELRWIMVTSGGMSYQHCCDRECVAPDRTLGTPRLKWETTRLKIVQKAYEQEVLELSAALARKGSDSGACGEDGGEGAVVLKKNNKKKNSSRDRDLLQQIDSLNKRLERESAELQQQKVKKKMYREALGNRREECSQLTETVEALRERLETKSTELQQQKEMTATHKGALCEQTKTRAQLTHTVESLQKEMKAARTETEAQRMRITALDKEVSFGTAIVGGLRSEMRTLQARNTELKQAAEEKRVAAQGHRQEAAKLERKVEKLERKTAEFSQELKKTEEHAAGKMRDQAQGIANLRDEVERLNYQHGLSRQELAADIQELEEEKRRLREDADAKTQEHEKAQAEIRWLTELNMKLEIRNNELSDGQGADLGGTNEEGVPVADQNMKAKQQQQQQQQQQQLDARVSQLEAEMQLKDDNYRRVEAELSKSREEVKASIRRHADHVTVLRNNIRGKEDLIRRLQTHSVHTPDSHQLVHRRTPGPGSSQQPLVPLPADGSEQEQQQQLQQQLQQQQQQDYQKQLQRDLAEARERADELQSKLDATTKAKTDEMAALARRCAEKVAAARDLEERCQDKDAYTASVEKQLEELRGNMEAMLGRVSVYHGRKRRRTEGPDFQV